MHAGARPAGQRIGPYEIVSLLGVGGMGEVYHARDSSLGRDVAIKLLPELWLSDPDRRTRFDREARVLASLNHPNIGSIYGFTESDGVRALVLELVEGDTLADRIASARAGLPAAEAIAIARQIAAALEAAHERGIIHRDLKPANIKITPDGRVKVLDFGLAKALPRDQGSELTQSPTLTIAGTRDGVLLGTAPYMSPEQARGKDVDTRTDIWAFGCVLYEMLTGTRAFPGGDTTEVLASVIKSEPDWRALPAETPPVVATYLRRCLHKEPRDRIHDMGDMRLAIEGAFDVPAATTTRRGAARFSRKTAAAFSAAGLVVGAAAATALLTRGSAPQTASSMRLQIATRPGADEYFFALSPDGLTVAYVAPVEASGSTAGTRIWLRSLERGDERPLMGTDFPEFPFWSPDGRSLGFFSAGSLKRIDIESGVVRTLAPAPQPRRAAWHPDGTIVFGPASVGPLHRVSDTGGTVVEATALLPGQSNHRWPAFIPGTREFLLFALGDRTARLYRGSLDSTVVERVHIDVDSEVAFLSPSEILFARQGALWAQRLNRDRSGPEGAMVPVASAFLMDGTTTGRAALSASATGSFAYRTSGVSTQLTLLDRSGREIGTIGAPDDAQMIFEAVSADGNTIALSRTVAGNADIWLMDRRRGQARRFTTDPAVDGASALSRDGRRIIYMWDGKGDVWNMYEMAVDGPGAPVLLLESGEQKNTQDWSLDGRHVLYLSQSPKTSWDVWAMPMSGDRKPFAVAATAFTETSAQFSPDARWVALSSDESGQREVYVQSFPDRGPRMQVSDGGGWSPTWRQDGRELFYRTSDNRIVSVPVATRGDTLTAGVPRTLFTVPFPYNRYEPDPDGGRFLFDKIVADPSPVTVVLNWKAPAMR